MKNEKGGRKLPFINLWLHKLLDLKIIETKFAPAHALNATFGILNDLVCHIMLVAIKAKPMPT